jgi:hypothetical protein
MIVFPFRVGDAFLNYDRHPITIPKKHYDELIQEKIFTDNSSSIDCLIVCPDGRKLAGQIYKGKAGYGLFYQIRVRGGCPSDHLGHLKNGQIIFVTIKKAANKVLVKIFDHLDGIVDKLLDADRPKG